MLLSLVFIISSVGGIIALIWFITEKKVRHEACTMCGGEIIYVGWAKRTICQKCKTENFR